MMHFDLIRDRGILLVKPDGPLEKSDFERLAKEVDPFIASNRKLAGVMIRTRSFPGWESLGALVSHFRFVSNHHRKIARVAVVMDGELLKILPRIADHFVEAEIRQFGFDQEDDALAWLASWWDFEPSLAKQRLHRSVAARDERQTRYCEATTVSTRLAIYEDTTWFDFVASNGVNRQDGLR